MRFDRLHTEDEEVDKLLGYLVDKTEKRLNRRVSAVYVTGSLAYGDFIPRESDIDGFMFFEGDASSDDLEAYDEMISEVEEMYPSYKKKVLDHPVSDSVLKSKERMREILGYVNLTSLIQSGKLIYGREIFICVRPPNRWELDTYMAETVGKVLKKTEGRVPCSVVEDEELLSKYSQSPEEVIEWLFYPARVLYTMKTGRIGSKRTAVHHYCLSHDDRFKMWLEQALEFRSEKIEVIPEQQLGPLMEVAVDFFWNLVNTVQTKMGLVRRGEEEVHTPAEAVNRFRRLLDVA